MALGVGGQGEVGSKANLSIALVFMVLALVGCTGIGRGSGSPRALSSPRTISLQVTEGAHGSHVLTAVFNKSTRFEEAQELEEQLAKSQRPVTTVLMPELGEIRILAPAIAEETRESIARMLKANSNVESVNRCPCPVPFQSPSPMQDSKNVERSTCSWLSRTVKVNGCLLQSRIPNQEPYEHCGSGGCRRVLPAIFQFHAGAESREAVSVRRLTAKLQLRGSSSVTLWAPPSGETVVLAGDGQRDLTLTGVGSWKGYFSEGRVLSQAQKDRFVVSSVPTANTEGSLRISGGVLIAVPPEITSSPSFTISIRYNDKANQAP